MKTNSNNQKMMLMAGLVALSSSVFSLSADATAMIDDFTAPANTHFGQPRQYLNDSMAGGATQDTHSVKNGILQVTGTITPPRGQPGWSSTVLPLAALGQAKDVSEFEGIKLRVRISQGNINLSANSLDITNFDFHASPVVVKTDRKFHEVKIPFKEMKRAWSAQTPLNTTNLTSLSIVAYSLQPAAFDYEIDAVSFY